MRRQMMKFWAERNRKLLVTLPASLMVLGGLAATPVQAFQVDPATKAAMDKRAAARTLLTSALSRVAANGNNAAALLDAGRASMALEDYRAALGFLLRAEQNAPRDGAVKAALGTAMVHQENPRRALDYFGEAQLLKTPERLFVADRALAYDLLGQQEAAQRDYALALSQQRDDEIIRRYALSLGISGHVDRAIEYLTPLLNQQDRSAWRTRAMILAMNGRQKEAKSIVDATMPKELATNIWPYLEQMDRLTPAQLAEAAHFGRFPSGPLGPKRPAQMAAATTPLPSAATTRGSRSTQPQQSSRTSRNSNSASAPVRAAAGTAVPTAQPAPRQATPARSRPAAAAQKPPFAPGAGGPASTVRDTTAAAATQQGYRSRVESIVAAQTAPPAPASRDAVPPPPVRSAPAPAASSAVKPPVETAKPLAAMASLGDIIGSLQIPSSELARSDEAVSADALARLRAERRRAEQAAAAERAAKARADAAAKAKADAEAKEKAEAAAKARAEEAKKRANPSRQWVQIGSGSNAGALQFTFDRYAKKHSKLFGNVKGGHSDWGRTRRLLAGPFTNRAAAQKFLDEFKKAEGDGFIFTSAVGEEVEILR